MFSIIIPVYKNEASLAQLVASLAVIARDVAARFERNTEVVFVVDGSPDDSYLALRRILPGAPFRSRLLLHSRNFGSFAAIRTGLAAAAGELFAVMAADLQEPPELMLEFLGALDSDECDVVVGSRRERGDPLANRIASKLFWRLYRRWVIPDIPKGGVDVFGCNRRFRDELVKLEESNSSLVGLLFWLGFRRKEILYDRLERKQGRSAWTFTRKLTYFFDSVFSFTDLPIRLLISFGLLGLVTSVVVGLTVFSLRILGLVDVPGYTATVLIVLFFGGLNALGLGIVGTYAWRGFENTKRRPLALVMKQDCFDGRKPIEIERGMSELRQ
jgi:glycosyltransferase involved in cell wall biosynthesis